ncbi:MAG: carbohydrate kinase, partial [Bacillota bacterium]|nr:carbohydrate kinase [Bacillota bacterium]
TDLGVSQNGGRVFERNPGGAVANVACGARKLGLKTAFIGKVGNDMHGRFLRDTLRSIGVGVDNLILADDVFTTLAFVSLSENGEREFSFARKPGADTCLRADEIDEVLLKSTKALHVGSLSMTDEPSRSATLSAVKTAKNSGALISYDPNYRAPLWKNVDEAVFNMRSLLEYADLIKISEEETELLTDFAAPEKALDFLLENGAVCAAVTLGKNGALAGYKKLRVSVPTFISSNVVDTTGAGDAFWAAFLSLVLKRGLKEDLTEGRLIEFVRYANAAASFCVGRHGAIPALPEAHDVEEILKRCR